MKGTVLGFDQTANIGHIRGEDGKRYSFTAADIRSRKSFRNGDSVDFEVAGNTAKELYILQSSGLDISGLRNVATRLGAGTDGAMNKLGAFANSTNAQDLSAKLSQNTIAAFLLGRPAVFYSVLILLAGLFILIPSSTLATNTNFYFSTTTPLKAHSLYGVASYIDEWTDEQSGIQFSSDTQSDEYKTAKTYYALGEAVRSFLYLYYMIPLFALIVMFYEFRGTPSPVLWRLSGGITIATVFVLGFLQSGLVFFTSPDNVAYSNIGAKEDLSHIARVFIPIPDHSGYTWGAILLILAAAASLAASFKFIDTPLAYAGSRSASGKDDKTRRPPPSAT